MEVSEKADKNLKRFLIICAMGLIVLCIYLIYCAMPLDEIKDYRVYVFPREDGSLDITYEYEWKVLSDSKEGPLKWVRLGVANPNYEVVGYGGAIESRRVQRRKTSEPMIELNLKREYKAGETVEFWFTLHQEKMLCSGTDEQGNPFYDFTPGWFDEIKVKHYTFSWVQSEAIVSHNADRREDMFLIWEGSLKKGGSRQMKVTYDMAGFDNPELVQWQEYRNGVEGGSSVEGSTVMLILIFTGIFAYSFSWGSDRENYSRGRGYHGYHGGRGGGGGCACACAGCACACACAGGGRAGCSKKDFYHAGERGIEDGMENEIEEKTGETEKI